MSTGNGNALVTATGSTTVRLGEHIVPVVSQRHARVRHLLTSGDFETLLSPDYGPRTYRLLSALIPALATAMPEWEFNGYGSPEAAERDEYDEETDHSPTTAQIVDAFEAIIKVSGGDRLGKLLSLAQDVRRGMEQANAQASTPTSPASPGSTGA